MVNLGLILLIVGCFCVVAFQIQLMVLAFRTSTTWGWVCPNRGIAYRGKGAYDQAIADHSKAIALKPDFGQAYYNRGNAYLHEGVYQQAIADYSEAIALDADSDHALWGRGLAYFYTARYESAQADLGRIALDKVGPYPAIWLYMTSQRLGADGKRRLAERAASFSRTAWPAPIVQLFLDQTTPAEVIAAARDDDPKKASRQGCEAAFYVEEYQLGKSDHAARLALFQAAEQACKGDPTMVEAEATRLELKRLRAAG
jgi:lipoprotein NlpI